MNSKMRKYLTVIALGLAGGSIYFPMSNSFFTMHRLRVWESAIRSQVF